MGIVSMFNSVHTETIFMYNIYKQIHRVRAHEAASEGRSYPSLWSYFTTQIVINTGKMRDFQLK